MVKEIVMDFDGTIALTFEVSIKILNNLSGKYGFRKVTPTDVQIFRTEGWKKAMKGFNISIFKIPRILLDGQKEIAKEMDNVKMMEGLKEVLTDLKDKGFTLGVLTSNSKENVEKFFEKERLEMFDYIYSDKSLFGKDKVINRLLRDRKLNKNEILYVGDEVRDWEACQKVGVKMIGVGWGFNTPEILKKNGLKSVVNSPIDLKKAISG